MSKARGGRSLGNLASGGSMGTGSTMTKQAKRGTPPPFKGAVKGGMKGGLKSKLMSGNPPKGGGY